MTDGQTDNCTDTIVAGYKKWLSAKPVDSNWLTAGFRRDSYGNWALSAGLADSLFQPNQLWIPSTVNWFGCSHFNRNSYQYWALSPGLADSQFQKSPLWILSTVNWIGWKPVLAEPVMNTEHCQLDWLTASFSRTSYEYWTLSTGLAESQFQQNQLWILSTVNWLGWKPVSAEPVMNTEHCQLDWLKASLSRISYEYWALSTGLAESQSLQNQLWILSTVNWPGWKPFSAEPVMNTEHCQLDWLKASLSRTSYEYWALSTGLAERQSQQNQLWILSIVNWIGWKPVSAEPVTITEHCQLALLKASFSRTSYEYWALSTWLAESQSQQNQLQILSTVNWLGWKPVSAEPVMNTEHCQLAWLKASFSRTSYEYWALSTGLAESQSQQNQ